MSTSYTTIYDSFLSKITDFDLPPLTDRELRAYCNRLMEAAIIKLPEVVSDLTQREVLEPNIITEVTTPNDNTDEPSVEMQSENIEPVEPPTYVVYINKPSYGNLTYEVDGLAQLVANESTFVLYINVSNFIKMLSFKRGTASTVTCAIYDDFYCEIDYDGWNTFVFSNVNPTSRKYMLLYITYDTLNTTVQPAPEPQQVEVSEDAQQAIVDDSVLEAEEVFVADLIPLEIEIIASQMVVEWINGELNNTQLTRMFTGTKDESMASQANHIEKLTTLKEKQHADVSMMIRNHAYWQWVKEDDS